MNNFKKFIKEKIEYLEAVVLDNGYTIKLRYDMGFAYLFIKKGNKVLTTLELNEHDVDQLIKISTRAKKQFKNK